MPYFSERPMRGKDYNAGLRGVLFDRKHYERMGAAIWLYGWLVLRQTHQQGPIGWVLGGAPVSYREIEEETGFNVRTVERWMQILRRYGYIETTAAPAGMVIRIMKAKKFPQAGRSFAERVRKFAEGPPQSSGPNACNSISLPQDTRRICSSSVDGSIERNTQEIHKHFHSLTQNRADQNLPPNPSCPGQEQTRQQRPKEAAAESHERGGAFYAGRSGSLDARLRQQLLRAERDEAVRRELAVGTGPEVERP
jgi:hypothetical protein